MSKPHLWQCVSIFYVFILFVMFIFVCVVCCLNESGRATEMFVVLNLVRMVNADTVAVVAASLTNICL